MRNYTKIHIKKTNPTFLLLTWILYENILYQFIALVAVFLHRSDYAIISRTFYYIIFAVLLMAHLHNSGSKIRAQKWLFPLSFILFFTIYYFYTARFFPGNLVGNVHAADFGKIYLFYFPVMLIASRIDADDFTAWLHSLNSINILMNLFVLVFYMRRQSNGRTVEVMDVAYMFALCTLVFLYLWKKEEVKTRKVVLLGFLVFDFIMLLLSGSRGAFLVPIVYSAILLMEKLTENKNLRRKLASISLIIISLVAIYLLYEPIVLLLGSVLGNTRIISFLLTGSTSTTGGRQMVFNMITNHFNEMPALGFGLMGDQHLTGGYFYAHNIALEFVTDFGWYIGVFALLVILFLLVRAIRCKKTRDIVLLIASYSLVQLNFSSTFLQEGLFWLLLGILVNRSINVHELVIDYEYNQLY